MSLADHLPEKAARYVTQHSAHILLIEGSEHPFGVMHLLELNGDVLQLIVVSTDREDLLKLAATCHFTQDLCIPRIMSSISLPTLDPCRVYPQVINLLFIEK